VSPRSLSIANRCDWAPIRVNTRVTTSGVEPQVAVEARTARAAIRRGQHIGPTRGLAPGYAQANLVILPEAEAADFRQFCALNAKPCPLLEVTEVGSPFPILTATGADLRVDLPRYRVFRDGHLVAEPADITQWWRSDLVSFLLGCSFTFEWALQSAGLLPAHQANVPMYVTDRPCIPAGRFDGPMVVTMRPFAPADVNRAAAISQRFPAMHGGPIHIGDPTALGITALDRPDFGDAVQVGKGQVPVFWACGVTPQVVIQRAALPLAIFHAPGHMFITDRPHTDFETAVSTPTNTEKSHVQP
jgi:uncharacterized protein YcsI (UPF0317 family)